MNGYFQKEIDSYYDSLKQILPGSFSIAPISALCQFDLEQLSLKESNVDLQEPLAAILVEMASKHYKNQSDYERGARLYYLQNQLEKKIVEETFSEAIFLTYNGSELNETLPTKLPILYMYSLRKGTSIKPWYAEG